MKAFMGLAMALAMLGASAVRADPPPASDASIHKLLDVTQTARLMDGMMTQMKNIMQQSALQAAGHTLDAQEQEIVSRNMGKLSDVMRTQMAWSTVEPDFVAIYRKNFSEKEVDDMLAFYQTPSGQALIAKMPEVMRESMQVGQAHAHAMVPQLQQVSQQMMQELKDYEASKSKQGSGSAPPGA
jgi:uncharacterized protein